MAHDHAEALDHLSLDEVAKAGEDFPFVESHRLAQRGEGLRPQRQSVLLRDEKIALRFAQPHCNANPRSR